MADKIDPEKIRNSRQVASEFYDFIEDLSEDQKAMLDRLTPEARTATMGKLATIYAGYAFDSDVNRQLDKQWGLEEQRRDMNMVEALLHKTNQCILAAFNNQPQRPLGIDLSKVRRRLATRGRRQAKDKDRERD